MMALFQLFEFFQNSVMIAGRRGRCRGSRWLGGEQPFAQGQLDGTVDQHAGGCHQVPTLKANQWSSNSNDIIKFTNAFVNCI